MTYSMQCDSPLGSITLASDGESLRSEEHTS